MLQEYEIGNIKLRFKKLNIEFNDIVGVALTRTSYKKIMLILEMKEWNEKNIVIF